MKNTLILILFSLFYQSVQARGELGAWNELKGGNDSPFGPVLITLIVLVVIVVMAYFSSNNEKKK